MILQVGPNHQIDKSAKDKVQTTVATDALNIHITVIRPTWSYTI